MKEAGTDTRYAYAVGRIRVMETKLLDDAVFETMLEEEGLKESVRTLAEYGEYSAISGPLGDAAAREGILLNELLKTYNLIYGMAREKKLVEPFFKKSSAMEKTTAPEEIDRSVWCSFREAWGGNSFLSLYLKAAIDLENIKIFFRVKTAGRDRKFLQGVLIEGGRITHADFLESFERTPEEALSRLGGMRYGAVMASGLDEYRRSGGLGSLERACDDFLTEYAKRAKYFPFGAEPLISFILAKENEVKNVRIVLTGKDNNFGADEIRNILRKSYV